MTTRIVLVGAVDEHTDPKSGKVFKNGEPQDVADDLADDLLTFPFAEFREVYTAREKGPTDQPKPLASELPSEQAKES